MCQACGKGKYVEERRWYAVGYRGLRAAAWKLMALVWDDVVCSDVVCWRIELSKFVPAKVNRRGK